MSIYTPPDYGNEYTPDRLFAKLKRLPGKVLALVALKAFLLYELLKERDTPVAAKAAIIAALGYLIMPLDGYPDPLPGGFSDDLAIMAGLLASLNYLITREIKRRAEGRVANLTGEEVDDDEEEDESEEDET